MATIFLITGLGSAVKEFRACGRPPREPNAHQRRGYSRPVSMIRYIHVLVLALTIELNLFLERTCKTRDRLTERRHKVTQFAYDAFRLVERACSIVRHSRWSKHASSGFWLCLLLTPCAQSTDSSVQEAMDIKRDCSERRWRQECVTENAIALHSRRRLLPMSILILYSSSSRILV